MITGNRSGLTFVYASDDPEDVFYMLPSGAAVIANPNKAVRLVEFNPAGGTTVRPLTPDENARWSYDRTPPLS